MADKKYNVPNVFEFEDLDFKKDPIWSYNNISNETAVVIDNGSHSCRVGWSIDRKPKLVFRNLIAKYRGKKESESLYFGNDIEDLEDAKWNIRTQFDMDVVTQFKTQEHSFDYLFSRLNINCGNSINHPVCLTEATCIPNLSRHQMSEMLFECYNVPKVIYGVGSLFSWNYNMHGVNHGLIISCGYQTTHVQPVVDGKFDAACCRRLNLGEGDIDMKLKTLTVLILVFKYITTITFATPIVICYQVVMKY